MKTQWRIVIFAAVLCIAAAACKVGLGEWKFWDKESQTEEPGPAIATFTPIPTQSPVESTAVGQTPTSTVGIPTVTPEPTATRTASTKTGASCLPGIWQINHESVNNYIYLTMLGAQEYGFTPQSSEGKLELQINSGQIVLLAEEFTVGVGVHVGDLANFSAFSALIDSQGFANYIASDTQVILTDILYDSEGTVTSLSTSFTVDFDDLLSLAHTLGFARGLPNPITSRTMNYSCSGDFLTIRVNPFASVIFDRVVD